MHRNADAPDAAPPNRRLLGLPQDFLDISASHAAPLLPPTRPVYKHRIALARVLASANFLHGSRRRLNIKKLFLASLRAGNYAQACIFGIPNSLVRLNIKNLKDQNVPRQRLIQTFPISLIPSTILLAVRPRATSFITRCPLLKRVGKVSGVILLKHPKLEF